MKGRFPSASRVRSGEYAENKVTNRTPYDPFHSQAVKIINKHIDKLDNQAETLFYESPPVTGFIQPLKIGNIKRFITSMPNEFILDLRGVFVCSGSKKQLKTYDHIYGSYYSYYKSIVLFPFPEDMCFYYKNKLKPSISNEYERHGAIWKREDKWWKLEFTEEALRSFYLRDVLAHEIGHHVDYVASLGDKRENEAERFAEWFAYEFGMRNPNREPTEFGKVLQEIIKGS